ncbi:hypothetical protein B0H14DRAFT_3892152 [Mycena olivaceomarginata]|nr:hypothetical protein B0H14DRAFT_3892152 [Mycena olivaceomarginata]
MPLGASQAPSPFGLSAPMSDYTARRFFPLTLTIAMPKLRPNPADPDMHAIYCYRWCQKNIDDYRRKNRERMARHRASDNAATPEERQARLEKRRFAAAQYREKHRWQLKLKERMRRAKIAEEGRLQSGTSHI